MSTFLFIAEIDEKVMGVMAASSFVLNAHDNIQFTLRDINIVANNSSSGKIYIKIVPFTMEEIVALKLLGGI
jgi:hypothetical protein